MISQTLHKRTHRWVFLTDIHAIFQTKPTIVCDKNERQFMAEFIEIEFIENQKRKIKANIVASIEPEHISQLLEKTIPQLSPINSINY